MTLTCGIDIENADRVERLLLSGLLPEDIFLTSELSCMHTNSSFGSVYFTAKEAVLKALGLGWSWGQASGQEIELCVESDRVVGLRLHGLLKVHFRSKGYRSIVIGHDRVGREQVTEVIMSDRSCDCPARCKVIVKIRDVEDILAGVASRGARIFSMDPRSVLTRKEQSEMRSRRKASYISGRIAAKQAVHDLLRTLNANVPPHPKELEIVNDDDGCPVIGNAVALGLHIIPVISISHSREYAAAVAAAYHGRFSQSE